MASEPPKVLISYSHDSPEHEQRVLELANRLRSDGVDCTIDQYVVVPEQGLAALDGATDPRVKLRHDGLH